MAPITHVNEERSQSLARLVFSWVCLLTFLAVCYFQDMFSAPVFKPGLAMTGGFVVFSIVWFEWVKRTPGRYQSRRNVTMVADIGSIVFFMHIVGRYGAMFYPIFLWIIIGNGIRFGEKYLVRGIIIGTVGFGSVVLMNPYWQAQPELGIGLLLSVIVLPVFYQSTLRRLRVMQELEVQLAESRLAEKAKDQFLAAMSHEIRTPMNGVLGMAESLAETKLDLGQRDQLQIMTRSVESLLNLINDILDYSKITAGNMSLESSTFNLKQVLEDIHQLLSTSAENQGLGMSLDYDDDMPTHFLGDQLRVRQVMLNLVGNAIKFTEEGAVEIRCRIKDGAVQLRVTDTGVGIPEKRLDDIFNLFEQVDNSTSRQYGGTGLGLAISRQLVDLMAGSIKVSSQKGKGSVFTVSLPLESCEAPCPTTTVSKTKELPQFSLRALVAEDNPVNQLVVARLLARLGVEAVIVPNGQEALDRLDIEDFDIVFMDVRMPVMNGHEATRHIRQRDDAKARIPILAVTADATKADVRMCLESGMDRHLGKPLRTAVVAEVLGEMMATTAPAV